MSQVIKDGHLYLYTNDRGDLLLNNQEGMGFFRQDTRFLHRLEWSLGEDLPIRILSVETEGATSLCRCTQETGKQLSGEPITGNTLEITRQRTLYDGVLYETFTFLNRGLKPVAVPLYFQFDADFADRAVICGNEEGNTGQCEPVRWSDTGLHFDYIGGDGVQRSLEIRVTPAPDTPGEGGSLRIPLYLEPKLSKKVRLRFLPQVDDEALEIYEAKVAEEAAHKNYQEWIEQAPRVDSDDTDFNSLYLRSLKDMRLLLADWGEGLVPVEGIPWHAAFSGRWSILAALQSLCVDAEVAKSAVRALARYQGKKFQPSWGEEPGKIPHVFRFGELSAIEGASPSFDFTGIDTTPLFLILIAQIYRWTGDIDFVREMMPVAQRALDWIDTYGDPGDFGYTANQPGSDPLYTLRGNAEEQTGRTSIALAEVQSYVYWTKSAWVELYHQLGNTEEARRLSREAEALKKRFRREFWLEKEGIPAFALDQEKKPIPGFTSKVGHGLLGGLYDKEEAIRLVERLFAPDMYSGWGIRTLSTQAERYNPFDRYHGSIWPHDNSFILLGLKEMGFHDRADQLIQDLIHASRFFDKFRLPQFYCGYGKEVGGLVPDPSACAPYAGSAGVGFVLLQTILGIIPDASRRRLQLSPRLPDGMNRLTVHGLKVGKGVLDVELSRVNGSTFLHLTKNTTGWSVNCTTESFR
ncbi:Glycogen debranching enzyme (alpha-1,6-glucosidase) [Marininema mesophilum]|uniref:Glycogen debranching enzyme (Alpha-1,6-glucosidase) n=1 Tax=Marininema mesophilum TaxID=1048340 RepID=A0A1H2ZX98_9BACL|nr:glycogen debranching N-terminal domain-containing protein [Marininema mesophilum]SDX21528.1 Glycogen debranching enzyme (alpha-1,6-glucosidase) [Marininema mesophilum]